MTCWTGAWPAGHFDHEVKPSLLVVKGPPLVDGGALDETSKDE